MAKYTGALSLTWANKHLRLLSHEDGSYEWVEPSDFRVSEVRLLHNVTSVGEVHPDRSRAKDNLLIRGESLHALTSLLRVPEFAAEYEGKVKLVYIDPPFNTGQAFTHYDDGLEHSVWLTMLRDRLVQIKRLLSDDGSVWVHLDDYEQHRARVVLDEVFGSANFVSTIIWQKVTGRDNRTAVSQSHDYIHVYAQSGAKWKNVRNLLPRSEEAAARYGNLDNDARGPWASDNMSAKAGPGRRASQFYTVTLPSGRRVDPPSGSCWRFTEKGSWNSWLTTASGSGLTGTTSHGTSASCLKSRTDSYLSRSGRPLKSGAMTPPKRRSRSFTRESHLSILRSLNA
jgi:adenine-specific DNA-methyltransferase